jgi:reductive dehalogenase
MPKITTPIVDTQTKFDQRDSMFSRAAAGATDHPLIRRWIEVEAPDPLIRALMGIPRAENSPLHHLIPAADGPLNPEPAPIDDTHATTDKIKSLAQYFGADLVGVCRLNQSYVVSNRGDEYSFDTPQWGQPVELNHQFAISMAFKRDYEKVRAGHSYIDGNDGAMVYNRAALTACLLAGYIRELGYPAKVHFERVEEILQVPVAVEAGLGELGRLGTLITPGFGPRIRLATVTTDIPLESDSPIDIGVQEFCRTCRKCAFCCPSGSIPKGERKILRGAKKWVINPETCLAYWGVDKNKHEDCSNCVAVCPYNRPDTWFNRAHHKPVFFKALKNPLFGLLMLWVDDLVQGRNPHPSVRWLNYTNK